MSGATDPLDSTAAPLPGLSKDCTVAINAQLATNQLFDTLLGQGAASAAAAESALAPAVTAPTTQAPPGSSASTTNLSTTAPSTPASATRPLTDKDIEALFDKIDGVAPDSLSNAFAELRKAALTMVDKTDADLAAVMASKPVVAALGVINAYVTGCMPATSTS